MEYRFNSEEWVRLTAAQRVHRCRLWAAEAQELAEKSSDIKMREAYLALARNWLDLAAEIEQHDH